MPVYLLVLVAQTPAADTYAAGLACYEQLDFHCAIELLSAAAREESGGDRARLLDIYRKLADSHLALGRREEAIADFVQLLRVAPDYRIEGSGTSPKILDAFGEARDRLRREEQAKAKKKAEPPPPAEPWMEVGLSAGAELLFGDDSDLLLTGTAFEVEANFILSGPWRAGGALRYAFHDLSHDSSTEHWLGGWASFSGAWQLGPLYTQAAVGFGVSRFFVIDGDGKTGLLIPMRLSVNIPMSGGLSLGLHIAPGWMVTMESDPKASFTLTLGGRIGMIF